MPNVVGKYEGVVPSSIEGTPGFVDINHELGTEYIASVAVINHVTKANELVTWRTVGPDIVRLEFGGPVAAGEYLVVVTG